MADDLSCLSHEQLITLVVDLKQRLRQAQGGNPSEVVVSQGKDDRLERLLSSQLIHRESPTTIESYLRHCPHCGLGVHKDQQNLIEQKQVVEIEPIELVVVQLNRYAFHCQCCDTQSVSSYPPGMIGFHTFGPRLETLLGMLMAERSEKDENPAQNLLAAFFH